MATHAGYGGDEGRVIAVDVGGTNIRAASVDRALGIHNRAHRAVTRSSPEALLQAMGDCVGEVAAEAPGALAIGVAMKGFVDPATGVMVASANLGMKQVGVAAYLAERFGLTVAADNDVRVAALGEIRAGAGVRWRDFLHVNVGTGIAVGLVLDGKLYRGADNLSGEMGHTTVDRNGRPCHCGLRGCLEAVVSGPGIEERYRELAGVGAVHRSASEILSLGGAGDVVAARILSESVEYLGTGIVNLVNLLNPRAIVLAGGVFVPGGPFVTGVVDFVRSRSIREAADRLESVAVSGLSEGSAGIVGAACLAWDRLVPGGR